MQPDLIQLKKNLLLSLSKKGIKDKNILKAIYDIPREKFVSKEYLSKVYEDVPLPIGEKQTISQPYTVAFMTELLDVKVGDTVLEVGTGSGYQAALLNKIGALVYTIERKKNLYLKAKKLFEELRYEIYTYYGDGSIGIKENAPYNKIIVTAASPKISDILIEQLKPKGRLVAPIGDRHYQAMTLVTKDLNGKLSISKHEIFKFVPLIGKEGWSDE